MTKLYFVRHGKTEWNLEDRMQGFEDSPLLPESYEQMKQCGDFLSAVSFDAVYVSPLKRARETAEGIVARWDHKPPIYEDARFKEMDFGVLEGKRFTEALSLYPKELYALRHIPDSYDPSPFKGESYESLIERSVAAVQDIVQNPDIETALIVGHGVTWIACLRTLLGVPLSEIRNIDRFLDNNSVSIIQHDAEEFILEAWNQTSFLK